MNFESFMVVYLVTVHRKETLILFFLFYNKKSNCWHGKYLLNCHWLETSHIKITSKNWKGTESIKPKVISCFIVLKTVSTID